ncbi:MAG: AI-2E family transporter [Bacteroidales bacterium]|jgi:predicted PurR-regulated permease PerM|nr:AI-2E family transporter [Bacteroidales bacterium]
MNSKNKKILGTTLGLLFLLFLIWYFSNIVAYIFIATILALIAQPLVSILSNLHIGKIKMPHLAAVIIGMVSVMAIIVALFFIITPLVANQIKSISSISISSIDNSLGEYIVNFENFLKNYGVIDSDTDLKSTVLHQVSALFSKIKISSFISNILNFIIDAFVGVFAVLFIMFFILRDNRIVYRALLLIIPEQYHDETDRILHTSKNLLSRYFISLFVDMVLVGGIEALILWALGVENAFLIGFLGGLLNVIPYLGPLMAAFLGLIIALASGVPYETGYQVLIIVYKVLGTFLFANLVDNFLFQPIIYSKSVKAHPLEIFLIIFVGAGLGGVIGMMIAIPAYTFIRIVAKEFIKNNRLVKRLTASINME